MISVDTRTGRSTLVTRSSTGTGVANDYSYATVLSPDGRWIVFSSYATDLVDDGTVDDNDGVDVFLHDRDSATTKLITRRAGSQHSANGLSYSPAFSPDSRLVAFESGAWDLTTEPPHVAPHNGNARNVFVYDIATESIVLASANAAGTGGASPPRDRSGGGRVR